MSTESAALPRTAPTGSNDLAEGLMLLRASTLKIIRLQLAIERHDRQVALEAVDGLVALDRRLQDYLEGIPAGGDQLMFRRELLSERAALNEEKLALAAEVLRRSANPLDQPKQHPVPIARDDLADTDDEWLGPRDLQLETGEQGHSHWWLAVTAFLAVVFVSTAYLLYSGSAWTWLTMAVESGR